MDLKGKIAIVTGGSRDIGREISLKLARFGAKVVVNYFNNPENAEETLNLICNEGGEAIIVKGDLTKESDVAQLVSEACKTYGEKIDIVVNNAGGLVARKKLEEIDVAFWDYLMEINLKTTFLVTKATVPKMTAGGSVINISSQAAKDGGGPGATAYATSKGAVMTFTRSMAKELGPKNIRVNSLCPGLIGTSFHDRFSTDEGRAHVASITPLGREGNPVEVADLVAYLASDTSSFITGTNIDINGGLYIS
ncbi:MAG: SDR family oxidoreductase [Proteobacteria bacterium]|nr:SDR family oxidoreductase [Pseudomonadota bacterium]